MRIPHQSASIDRYEQTFGAHQHCEGKPYYGAASFESLIHNPLTGSSFCSPERGIRAGMVFAGLSL